MPYDVIIQKPFMLFSEYCFLWFMEVRFCLILAKQQIHVSSYLLQYPVTKNPKLVFLVCLLAWSILSFISKAFTLICRLWRDKTTWSDLVKVDVVAKLFKDQLLVVSWKGKRHGPKYSWQYHQGGKQHWSERIYFIDIYTRACTDARTINHGYQGKGTKLANKRPWFSYSRKHFCSILAVEFYLALGLPSLWCWHMH